ncbi:hypothetical protein HS5_26550 [Acidianus sp. HS-5]|nr:hypothetical protein HS5_26550 [Acidianus sp. HS-5]
MKHFHHSTIGHDDIVRIDVNKLNNKKNPNIKKVDNELSYIEDDSSFFYELYFTNKMDTIK